MGSGGLCPCPASTSPSRPDAACLFQSYLFLLSSDYERSEWREAIQKLQKKGEALETLILSSQGVCRGCLWGSRFLPRRPAGGCGRLQEPVPMGLVSWC